MVTSPIHRVNFQVILPLLVVFLFAQQLKAQLYHIPHKSGTVLIGSTSVTVTTPGPAIYLSLTCGGIGHTRIGYNSDDSTYLFEFSKPTDHVRFILNATHHGEELWFKVNDKAYTITNANLSAYPGSCNCQFLAQIVNGKITFPSSATSSIGICTQVDIYYPRIDSVRIFHNALGDAAGFSSYFEEDTSAFIQQPFADTVLCPGQVFPLVYSTNFAFKSGNSFTAQLSNASGSFASPVNIGSHTDTTGDTIWCTIPVNTAAGNGYRVRIVSSNPADTSLDNQGNIRIKAAPAAFGNSSNTPVCTGDTLKLNGSSSSTGVSWAWAGPNGFSSSAEDTFIANAAMGHAGNYILTATLNSTGCSLKDTATVVMNPTPAKPNAGSNSPVCETLPLALNTSTSTTGVSYSWSGPGSYSSNTQNPTVSSNAAMGQAGNYISTVTLNGCSSRDTVTVVVLPKPARPTAGAPNSPLCANQDLQLTASTVANANYTWYGPAAFSAAVQNPTRYSVTLTHAGKYFVYAAVNGCHSDTDSVAVVVNTDPNVNIFPSPGATICQGQEATFTAVASNAGSSPAYRWFVNGLNTGGTGTSYKTKALNNGDIVTCEMTSIGTCATPFYDTSAGISMTVTPVLAPVVSIAANPNHVLYPNEPVTFTATAVNAGSNPTYQWKRNGKDVGGATGATWGGNANFLSNGDEICVVVKSNYTCPNPDTAKSNCIQVQIKVGVEDVYVRNNNIRIYPNPVQDILHIEGITPSSEINLYDVVGRKVRHSTSTADKASIDMGNLPKGNYLLRIDEADGNRMVEKVVR